MLEEESIMTKQKNILIWKVKEETAFLDSFEESLKKNEERYYILNAIDRNLFSDDVKIKYGAAFVFADSAIRKGYLLEIKRIESDVKMYYQVLQRLDSKLVIENLKSCLELDLGVDFEERSYLSIESSIDGYKQIRCLSSVPYEQAVNKKQIYKSIDEEKHLSSLSQKNEYCERIYGIIPSQRGRGEFQRDYDRIVHSKAFRRMVDKAQIFSASKGDYYRTRMTHTLTVAQIAKGICNALNLNTYLTEAIALGHDLGHTPFGHQGERTLDNILNGTVKITPDINSDLKYGGFKHNYQTLRTVCYLEENYIEYAGLDLSFQTLEGMWKHTGTKYSEGAYRLEDFFPKNMIEHLYPNEVISTLEGQIVAIADEIAQRGHDLDDAFSSGLITIQDLISYLELKKMRTLHDSIKKGVDDIEHYSEQNRIFVDEREMEQNRAVSEIISYFIREVIRESRKQMENYDYNHFIADNHRVKKQVIHFSKEGKILCDYLEKIITKKVLNSSEVSLFDERASKTIKDLFQAYYANPQLLHKGTLQKLYRDYRKITINVIDFHNGDFKLIREEWRKITKGPWSVEESYEYQRKRVILVRNICDFIGGMTDSYAMEEHRRIYGG